MHEKFPLTSEQLDLLMAFEAAEGSLVRLADNVRRDPSVVSRNLARLAEDAPVLAKVGGKWRLTTAGRRVNALSREYLTELAKTLARDTDADRTALVVINAQQALKDPRKGTRSNPGAEANLVRLLAHWRADDRPLVHVRHVATHADSPFHPSQPTAAFLPDLAPEAGEWVIDKASAGAFSGTRLEAELRARGIETLLLTGFTANECVDATAKQAADLGFAVIVVADATAMFDIIGPDGTTYPAAMTQELLLASLHASCARVVETNAVINGEIRT